jgi:chemotaxis protein MotC
VRLARWLGVVLLLSAASAAHGQAANEIEEPVKLVRTLQLLQDQIAHGTLVSEGARRALIDTIGTRLLSADPETWRDPRNVDAALLYVLSGGNPAILAKLPSAGDDAPRAEFISAVGAYATGSQQEAAKLWAPVDLSTLPVSLVGPSALAKATLLMNDDPKQAMHFVDIARLESPGTLIEEAAVRRGIEIAARLEDAERFELFASRYATRFPRSMYAEAFRHRFSQFYLAIASQDDGQASPKLETILAPLANDDRREIFLEIARLAIVRGEVALGKSAAESAVALSGPGTTEMRRAQFYRAAAFAIGEDPGAGSVELAEADAGELPPADRELLSAVLTVMDEIQRWPEVVGDSEPPPVEKPEGEDTPPESAPASVDVAQRARDAVDAAKRLLSETGT